MIDPDEAVKLAKLYLSDDIQNFGEIIVDYDRNALMFLYNTKLFLGHSANILCYFDSGSQSGLITKCRYISTKLRNILNDVMAALDRVNF